MTAPVTAVVLAGGEGQRLRPLTDKVPKPLLRIGRTTILDRVLESLARSDIADVWIAVNYKADMIEEHVGDGAALGLRVRYLREDEPLYTAGCLSLLPDVPTGPVVVTNSDQVTNLDYAQMVAFHQAQGAAVTIGAFDYAIDVPYGVLDVNDGVVQGIEEKPTLRVPCNGGIYVLDPDVLGLVPPRTYFGMDELVRTVMGGGRRVSVFPIETWIDIGTPDELDRALRLFVTGEEL